MYKYDDKAKVVTYISIYWQNKKRSIRIIGTLCLKFATCNANRAFLSLMRA